MESRRLRRSLFVVNDVVAGQEITSDNLRAIRPGYGLDASQLESLFGKKFNQSIARGTPMGLDFTE